MTEFSKTMTTEFNKSESNELSKTKLNKLNKTELNEPNKIEPNENGKAEPNENGKAELNELNELELNELNDESSELELKIDIDYKPPNIEKFAEEFARKIIFIFKTLGIDFESVEVYETNKGYHIYVYAYSNNPIDNKDIIMLQLMLGSDYKRELFNMMRVNSGEFGKYNRSWNVLFMVKRHNRITVSMEVATENAEKMTEIINKICYEHFI